MRTLAGVIVLPLLVLAVPAASLAQSITVTKTVGTTSGVCAATDEITVAPGTTVYYCYAVKNTGDRSLGLHDLADSELGTLFTGVGYTLTPGSSVDTVAAGLTYSAVINVSTTNTATWTAYNTGPTDTAQAQASATVHVSQPAITLRKTVGTTPGVCAVTDEITVVPGTTVYYCYTVTNICQVNLTSHDLTDDKLGTLLSGVAYSLAPGSSVDTVAGGFTYSAVVYGKTTNSATWTAHVRGSPATAQASSSATVNMAPPIPALDPAGLAALALMLALAALWASGRRR